MKQEKKKKVILIHDKEGHIALPLAQELEREKDFQFCVDWVETKEGLLAALREKPDIILAVESICDVFNALDALKAAKEECPQIPFIYVLDVWGTTYAQEMIRQGATDCISKDQTERLAFMVVRELNKNQMNGANLVPICSSCHRVSQGQGNETWVSIGGWLLKMGITCTHTLCPACAEEYRKAAGLLDPA